MGICPEKYVPSRLMSRTKSNQCIPRNRTDQTTNLASGKIPSLFSASTSYPVGSRRLQALISLERKDSLLAITGRTVDPNTEGNFQLLPFQIASVYFSWVLFSSVRSNISIAGPGGKQRLEHKKMIPGVRTEPREKNPRRGCRKTKKKHGMMTKRGPRLFQPLFLFHHSCSTFQSG